MWLVLFLPGLRILQYCRFTFETICIYTRCLWGPGGCICIWLTWELCQAESWCISSFWVIQRGANVIYFHVHCHELCPLLWKWCYWESSCWLPGLWSALCTTYLYQRYFLPWWVVCVIDLTFVGESWRRIFQIWTYPFWNLFLQYVEGLILL